MRGNIDDAISTLLTHCSDNHEWYRAYMMGSASRILADADFVAERFPTTARVLDIGAIPPLLVELLRQRGYRHCAVADPHLGPFTKYFAAYGIEAFGMNLLQDSAQDLRHRFDLVALNDVIEHIGGNLLTTVTNAVECISPGGHLMLTTPNLRSIWGLYALLRRSSGLASKPGQAVRAQYDRASSAYGYYGHIREYTKREIQELMASFGLELEHCEFQKNYLDFGRPTPFINFIENFFPNWRLFGKYLFLKAADKR